MSRGEHRAPGWFRAARGRPQQPAGRHTPEYVAKHGDGIVGMHPVGGARRDPYFVIGDDHERGDRHHPDALVRAAAQYEKQRLAAVSADA